MTTAKPHFHAGVPGALQHWKDPEQSCGQHFHSHPSGKQYWEAIGPAAKAWSSLSPEIRAVVEASGRKDPTFSVHMVMIGQSRQTSSPKILLSSKDLQMQEAVRDAVLLSDILNKYPSIGIDFCSNPPEHLANSIQQESPALVEIEERGVWATNVREEFGRRLFICGPDGGPPRVATGGPILFAGPKAYQTTVGHVFLNSEKAPSPVLPSSFLTDLDLEPSDSGEESDSEDDNGYNTEGVEDEDEPAAQGLSLYPEDLHNSEVALVLADGDQGPSMSSDVALGKEQVGGNGKDPEIPRNSDYIGKLAYLPLIEAQEGLDYALVELEVGHRDGRNLVSCGPPGSDKKVRVKKPGQISAIGLDTIIVVTSSGPVIGKLSATPAYIKPEGQRKCQEMYAVRVDDHHFLEPGDCGSGVIDVRTGEIFGHIVFGHPGTHVAYILPMERIIEDIARVLKQNISFTPTPEIPQDRHPVLHAIQYLSLQPERHMMRGNTPVEPYDFTEFASPRYHKNLNNRKMPKRHRFRSLREAIRGKTAVIRALGLGRIEFRKKRNKTFESLFFSLPSEIRDQIIKELPFRSIMNLRRVSRAWRTEVLTNDSAITKLFLVHNPLPPFTRKLYSNPSPDIQYIQEVWHRHRVASKLAAHIAKWLRQEVYLYRSRYQQRDFQLTKRKIQQRLVPIFFTLYHFFEKYSQSLLQYPRSQQQLDGHVEPHEAALFPFELEIMEMYSNDILLHTHQVFKILVTFLCRILRPPTYYGHIERLARGYLRKEPAKMVHAAILCVGGLDAVVKLAEINDYMQRRAAVDKFYSSLSNPPKDTSSSPSNPEVTGSDASGRQPTGNGSRDIAPVSGLRQEDIRSLLPQLPALDDIWCHTGKALLLRRKVVERPEDIKGYTQMLTELIQSEETLADRLYDGHQLWHALSDHDFGDGGDSA